MGVALPQLTSQHKVYSKIAGNWNLYGEAKGVDSKCQAKSTDSISLAISPVRDNLFASRSCSLLVSAPSSPSCADRSTHEDLAGETRVVAITDPCMLPDGNATETTDDEDDIAKIIEAIHALDQVIEEVLQKQ